MNDSGPETTPETSPRSHAFRLLGVMASAAVLCLTPFHVDAEPSVRPDKVQQIIGREVARLISRNHYSQHRLDDEISKKLFIEYFERLDRKHSYFLASDIEDFRSYEVILDDLLLQGNIDFAFDVYARFLQRVRERVEFAKKRLGEPFDFDKQETLLIDRSEEPWAKTRDELDELWRKRLKNRLLVYRMMPTEEGKDADEKTKDTDAPDGDQPPTQPQTGDGKAAPAAPETDKDNTSTPPPPKAPDADPNDPQVEGDDAEAESAAAAPTGNLPAKKEKTPVERSIDYYEKYLHRFEEKEAPEILETYLSSLTRIYDPHSAYMAPDTEEDFDIQMKLSLQGIGALLTVDDSYIKVAGILPGGPAEFDGRLKEGDRILAVRQQDEDEGVDVVDVPLRKAVKLIRGPKGTRVYLTIWEAGKPMGSVPVVIDILRDEVKLTEQEAKLDIKAVPLPAPIPGDDGEADPQTARIAVINLPSFYADFQAKRQGKEDYKSSTRDVHRLIDEASEEHLDGLILDLRSNGGGSLEEAIELAGLFFSEGPVVQVRKTGGRIYRRHDPDSGIAYAGPLLVMVDRLSASASEIVAAALQDHHRAVILGEAGTHGKGTVQTVYKLDRKLHRYPVFKNSQAGSLKFTMAKFYRVNGGSTQVKGVTPDLTVRSITDCMELGEAHLPHVMPWDEIEAIDFTPEIDVTPYIPQLRTRFDARVAADPDFQKLMASIDEYAERKDRKTLPLAETERRTLQEEEEAWSERIKKLRPKRKRSSVPDKDEKNGEEEDEPRDLLLDEALDVMADLVTLQSGHTLPPVAVAVSDVAPDGTAAKADPAAAAAEPDPN